MLEIAGLGKAVPIRSGRAGIVIALKGLGLRRGSGVGVPLYCCPVVFKSIIEAGYKPVFLDTEPGEYHIAQDSLVAKNKDVSAVIAVHMFGQVCDMPSLLNLAQGRPVIEDCAQSLGSLWQGKPSGSFGSIAVFSFRSGKYLSAGEGGALLSNDSKRRAILEAMVADFSTPGRLESSMHIIKTYLRSKLRGRALWGPVGSKMWSYYNKNTEFIKKAPIKLGRIFPSDMAIAMDRMGRLSSMVEKQRNNAAYYLSHLSLDRGMFCIERERALYNRFMFPIKFRSPLECQFMADWLRTRGISNSRPYLDVVEGARGYYGYKGDCPNAESLLSRTLVIPVHHKLARRDLEYIVESVNKAWKTISRA